MLYHRRFASVLPTEECGGEIICIISDDRQLQSRGTQAMGGTVHTVNRTYMYPSITSTVESLLKDTPEMRTPLYIISTHFRALKVSVSEGFCCIIIYGNHYYPFPE